MKPGSSLNRNSQIVAVPKRVSARKVEYINK